MFATLAINAYPHLLEASIPLLSNEKVDAIEWSFDTIPLDKVPDWFSELLDAYASENRLIGHGVFFGMMRGVLSDDQKKWLKNIELIAKRYRFDHISEHFGYFTGKDFHSGAPMAVPMNETTIAIGRDRLMRIQQACGCRVGIENLAFSGNIEEVMYHGEFLDKLLEPIDGFVLLDIHNIYCQMVNFDLSFEEIIKHYPLHRVREIHLSGGSWDTVSSQKKIRRDTHDSAVPVEIFELLDKAIVNCPNLKFVTLEQMDYALESPDQQAIFRNDFQRIIDSILGKTSQSKEFVNPKISPNKTPIEDKALYEAQLSFSDLLENSENINGLLTDISENNSLYNPLNINSWNKDMLETAMRIARKWK